MIGRRLRGAAVLVGLLVATVAIAPSAVEALGRSVPPRSGVPVLGQAYVSAIGQTVENPPTMVLTIHAVRRIAEATVIYYSVGFPGEAPDPQILPVTAYGSGPGSYATLQASPGATFMDSAAVVDVPGRRAYGALRLSGRAVAAPPPVAESDRVRLSGRAVVQWIALSPLPARVEVVDVYIGSAFVPDVPVGDGPLTPVVDDPAPVAGTGWPRVDTLDIADARADGPVSVLSVHIGKRTPSPTPSSPATPSGSATPSPSETPSPGSGSPSATGTTS